MPYQSRPNCLLAGIMARGKGLGHLADLNEITLLETLEVWFGSFHPSFVGVVYRLILCSRGFRNVESVLDMVSRVTNLGHCHTLIRGTR